MFHRPTLLNASTAAIPLRSLHHSNSSRLPLGVIVGHRSLAGQRTTSGPDRTQLGTARASNSSAPSRHVRRPMGRMPVRRRHEFQTKPRWGTDRRIGILRRPEGRESCRSSRDREPTTFVEQCLRLRTSLEGSHLYSLPFTNDTASSTTPFLSNVIYRSAIYDNLFV